MESPPEDDFCSICHDSFTLPCQANCSHWFCGEISLFLPLARTYRLNPNSGFRDYESYMFPVFRCLLGWTATCRRFLEDQNFVQIAALCCQIQFLLIHSSVLAFFGVNLLVLDALNVKMNWVRNGCQALSLKGQFSIFRLILHTINLGRIPILGSIWSILFLNQITVAEIS